MDGSAARQAVDDALVGGRERVPIVIVPYDPMWAPRFTDECRRIVAALGSGALRVEHIGSTAVPGLAAKPIIDVLVWVRSADDERTFAPAFEAAGYVLCVRELGHRMFRSPDRSVHVHVRSADAADAQRELVFRDRLRRDEADRALYERTKRELAAHDWDHMNEYAEAKTPIIAAILARAAAEGG